jgi:YrbI family 3-deoxy-D-manno-octulosonate 8-phosphate phosphatase
MSVIAIVPARGGSKGIPQKNLRAVGGVPLIVRAVRSLRAVASIDRVVVSTDDVDIAAAALAAGAEVVDRPDDLAGDAAGSEAALLHALGVLDERGESADDDVLVFAQATSPFLDRAALDDAVRRVRDGGEDSVFAATPTHVFLWRAGDERTGAVGVNHDRAVRPRRQDREPEYAETGAFYVMRAAGFRTAGHRFFGRVGIAAVDPRGALEIDTFDELELADAIAPLLDDDRAPAGVATGGRALLRQLETPIDADAVVTDFDGVHTDDRVIVSDDGHEYVIANRADGMGVRMLREAGVPMLILSTEVHSVVAARARKLQVDVIHGSDDKAAALQYWADEHDIDLGRVAYLGNDVNDLGCLGLVGWPVSVADAKPEVRAAARVVLDAPGGRGAVRELADRVLRARADALRDGAAAAGRRSQGARSQPAAPRPITPTRTGTRPS